MTGKCHDFKLLYRSNGGDNCNMKRVKSIIEYLDERIVVVYRKKGT